MYEKFINNHIQLGWVNNKQIFDPFSPWVRVILDQLVDYDSFKNRLYSLNSDFITYIPNLIFKNKHSRAVHVNYYLINHQWRPNLISSLIACGDLSIINNVLLKMFMSIKDVNLINSINFEITGSYTNFYDIYYCVNSELVFVIKNYKELSSIDLFKKLIEAQTKLKTQHQIKFSK